jgi:ribosomal protein L23
MVKLKEEEKKQLQQEKAASEYEAKKDRADKSAGVAKQGVLQQVKAKSEKNKEVKEKAASTIAPIKTSATLHDLEVLLYPLVTEKAVNMIESENKITFVVNDNIGKSEVKKAVEEAYGVKVIKINVVRDMKGRKKAIVKLDKKNKASELATKLGVL